jgi:hypothetical protein
MTARPPRTLAAVLTAAIALTALSLPDPASAAPPMTERSTPIEAGPIIPDADPIAPATMSPGQSVRLQAELTSDLVYGLWLDAPSGDAVVTVTSPFGDTVSTDDAPGADRTVVFSTPVDGAHVIEVTPAAEEVGSWRFQLVTTTAAPLVDLPTVGDTRWITTPTVEVTWSVASVQEIEGYAVVVDEEPDTLPAAVPRPETGTTLTLPEGESWLHVRTRLADGTWGPTTHRRLLVDSVPPDITGVHSDSHPDATTAYDSRTVHLRWDVPADTSGIATTTVEVAGTRDGEAVLSLRPDGTEAEVDLPEDGIWFLRVRADDVAGQIGASATVEVTVDGDGPAAPEVSSSHQDGVPSGRRVLSAAFASADDRPISHWSAVVDQAEQTVPDPALAQTEPQITTTLAPGTWWLHVAAQDTRGRWSAPTHRRIVVTDTPAAVLRPAGSPVWAHTVIPVSCGADTTGPTLVTVDASGSTVAVGTPVLDGNGCSVQWDPTASEDGERRWPDGDYHLVLVDGSGAEVSARVAVTVAVASSSLDRLLADYRSGVLDPADLADLLALLLTDPGSVPDSYTAGAVGVGLSTGTLVDVLSRLDATARHAVLSRLHPEPAPSVPRRVSPRAASPAPSCRASQNPMFPGGVCTVDYPGFTISYAPTGVGPATAGQVPRRVTQVYEALDYARSAYRGMGFAVPTSTVRVHLVAASWTLAPGSGYSLPDHSITMNVSNGTSYYLPAHEYFHQVQYQYLSMLDQASEAYWWMEATAEWAAHRVQERADYPESPRLSYAFQLPKFLASEANLHMRPNALLSPGGGEYGAFVLAEYLEDRFEGDEAIRWVWDRIGDGAFGVAPLTAIAEYVERQGTSYAAAIEEFRLWTYVLERSGSIGFTDPDARNGGLWRQALGTTSSPADDFRRVTATGTVDVYRDARGEVSVAASNTAYIELGIPSGRGVVQFRAFAGSPANGAVSSLSNIRFAAVPLKEYPTLCAEVTRSIVDFSGVDAVSVVVAVPAGCSTLTFAVTNTSRSTLPTATSVAWSASWHR